MTRKPGFRAGADLAWVATGSSVTQIVKNSANLKWPHCRPSGAELFYALIFIRP